MKAPAARQKQTDTLAWHKEVGVVQDDYDKAWRNRIENKLDGLSEAVVGLARMEERMVTLFSRMDTYDHRQATMVDRLGLMSDRIVELEKASMTIRTIERVLYVVGSAGVASLFWFLQQ
jgi:hypothetical protein